jgi:hypothetical protein
MVSAPVIYIGISILVLAIIWVILIYTGKVKPKKKFSKIAQIAIFLVIAGTIFSDNPWLGYGLIGAGVALSIIDIIRNRKK